MHPIGLAVFVLLGELPPRPCRRHEVVVLGLLMPQKLREPVHQKLAAFFVEVDLPPSVPAVLDLKKHPLPSVWTGPYVATTIRSFVFGINLACERIECAA